MSVGRMLQEMDSREIAEWMAFFAIENDERTKPKKKSAAELTEKLRASIGGRMGKGGLKKGRKPAR